jgi:cyclophilin family peptidyl-prolyl cis-trans isomerase
MNPIDIFAADLFRIPRLAGAMVLAVALATSGCDARPGAPSADGIPVAPPDLAAGPAGALAPGEVAAIEAQARRDGATLIGLLGADAAPVRARAALALASVQDPEARPALEAALADPDARVRERAAFALGQVALPDGGARLVAALHDAAGPDTDLPVRLRIVEALGKRGGDAAAEALLAWTPAPDATDEIRARQLALGRLAMRGATARARAAAGSIPSDADLSVTDAELAPERLDALVDALLSGLSHPDGTVRSHAAWALGRLPDVSLWQDRAGTLREALAAADADDASARELLLALGGLRDAQDLDAFARWLAFATDWRTRTTAAEAIGARGWVGTGPIREALRQALDDDPSPHVRIAAAEALSTILPPIRHPELGERSSGDPSAWRWQVPFLVAGSDADGGARMIAWVRGLRGEAPAGVVRGIELLRTVPEPAVDSLFFELAEDADPRVQSAAVRALSTRWDLGFDDLERHARLFLAHLAGDDLPAALASASVLGHPAFHPYGSVAALEAAFEAREEVGPAALLAALLEAMGETGDPGVTPVLERALEDDRPSVRVAAAEGLEHLTGEAPRGLNVPVAPQAFDAEGLEALGARPVWVLETERGTLRIRMLPDQAPLTVLSIARLAAAGAYDGTPFHRVLGGFVVQGGDIIARDGTGDPGFRLPSEFTLLPFRRGTVGMASLGKDTEAAQFFVTHADHPHLDGLYTAFGWVEEGAEVLDALLRGDLLLSSRIEADEGP